MRFLVASFMFLLVVFFLMLSWFAVPSSILFRPIEWSYDSKTGTAVSIRTVNTPKPALVRWAHIVYVPGGKTCSLGGVRYYDNLVRSETIPISPILRECLDQPNNIAELSWSPYWLGIVPMRPFFLTVPKGAVVPR